MWYQALKNKQQDDKNAPNYEEVIIMSDAKKVILKKLFLKSDYNPSESKINRYLAKFRDMLINEYGSIANVRNATSGLEMMPLVEQKVSEMFKE
jgi:hypothetical protein